MSDGPHVLDVADVHAWARASGRLDAYLGGLAVEDLDYTAIARTLDLPLHVAFAATHLVAEDQDASIDRLSSIPFRSLCKGLLLPLSGMSPEKAAHLFGLLVPPPLTVAEREALLATFFAKDLGLDLVSKLACVLGDPFRGRGSSVKRDSLVRLLLTMDFVTRREALDHLARVGDVAVLFSDAAPAAVDGPPLTAAEVLETLRFLPRQRGEGRFDLLRSLFARCGKLEAYFLAKLVLRKAGLGFEYEGPLLARAIGARFGAPAEMVSHAMALTDPFRVVEILAKDGIDGLRRVQLQPLVPVRPALASGTTAELAAFPVWVERKYDGIRFMLHKATDASGATLCGAYTRNRRDWLELVAGLQPSIAMLPCRDAIVDGELYGTLFDGDAVRPANVYEVYQSLQGERARPIQMKFAAFDLLYLNGQDLTRLPLSERRARLQALIAPLGAFPSPVPIALADGQLAGTRDDVNRLYGHFRAQGYEGVITKDLGGTYLLAERDPAWKKRKPEETLDLVLLAGVFAVTEKTNVGLFGSFAIGALAKDGGFVDVGDVAGVDRVSDAELQGTILREGLITGRRIERASASGVRPGLELRPHIVVTVRFEGIVKDPATGAVKLRDPKLVAVRSDKGPTEIDGVADMEAIELRHRMG